MSIALTKDEAETALVTGGCGFIGVHLVEKLIFNGYNTVVIDDGSQGSFDRLGHLPSAVLIEGDIREREATFEAVSRIQPDHIFHLAARHFIPDCIADPVGTINVNVAGTLNILDATTTVALKSFVLASTADVYAPSVEPHEEASTPMPNNIYGLSKLMCEHLVRMFSEHNPGVKVNIGRLFNVYGPGETNPHLLPAIFEGLKTGDSLRLGNVATRRDYVYVTDVVTALLQLSESSPNGTIVNIGTGSSVTAKEIVALASSTLGRQVAIEVDPDRVRSSDRVNLQASTALRDVVLDRVQWTEFSDGLRLTLKELGID